MKRAGLSTFGGREASRAFVLTVRHSDPKQSPRRRRGRLARLLAATVCAGLAATAAGCGGGGAQGASLILYNGQHSQLTTELVSAFEKQTGISVRVRLGDSIVLADQILQEGSNSPADIFLSENSPELMTLQQRGLLAAEPAATLSQVPSSEDSPNGDWVGVALRVGALVFDPALVSRAQLPHSILDLAQPRWKGKISVAPTDADFPPLAGSVLYRYGSAKTLAWLQGLRRNAVTYVDEESVAAAVNRGNVAVGLINQYYWYRLRYEFGKKATHSALYYFPSADAGSVTNISGAGVLKSSKHKTDAERFVAFLVSRRGQEIIARSDDFEYPVRRAVTPNSALPPIASISHAVLTPSELGNDQQVATLIQKAGLY
ncbi:MAG TPA: extracellular solute-binding protein [Solirubrobacteraceae bacterium]|jgi:iron(III) transport system substrate-binding protein